MPKTISTEAQKLAVKAAGYVAQVCDPSYVRCMRNTILWSFIPLFFIYAGLGVSGENSEGAQVSFLSMSVTGITNGTLYGLFLILNGYYGLRFAFAFLKVWLSVSPFSLFARIFGKKGQASEMRQPLEPHDVYGEIGKTPIPENVLAKYPGMEHTREVGGFVLQRSIFGLLEHFLGKMIIPLGLWLWALVCIVRELRTLA